DRNVTGVQTCALPILGDLARGRTPYEESLTPRILPGEVEGTRLHGVVGGVVQVQVRPSTTGPVASVEVIVFLHDAKQHVVRGRQRIRLQGHPEDSLGRAVSGRTCKLRSEEHTSELQSRFDIV